MLNHKHPECGELAWIYSQGMKLTNDLVILKCSHELVIEVVLICRRLQLQKGWVLLKKVIFVGKQKKPEEKMEDLKFVLCCHLLSDLVPQHPHPKMLCKCYRQCHYRKCRCECKCNLLLWIFNFFCHLNFFMIFWQHDNLNGLTILFQMPVPMIPVSTEEHALSGKGKFIASVCQHTQGTSARPVSFLVWCKLPQSLMFQESEGDVSAF